VSDFRKLQIWQRARVMTIRVHRLVQRLPPVERTRRGDQLIRTAISIRHNIAEGSGRGTPGQSAQFLSIAAASANEPDDAIEELDDVGLLAPEDRDLMSESRQIAAMIVAFRKTL
jgi:four helix bundle protein